MRAHKFILIGLACTVVAGRGCEQDLGVLCTEEVAALGEELAEGAFAYDRRLAQAQDMSDEERESCARWARRRLDKMQFLLDRVQNYPELRPQIVELNQLCTQLVMVHGFCERGEQAKLTRMILGVRDRFSFVANGTCHGQAMRPQSSTPVTRVKFPNSKSITADSGL